MGVSLLILHQNRSAPTQTSTNFLQRQSLGEQFGVEGFPTLKYFAPGSTDGENYEGKRAWDDMLQFLQEKVSARRMNYPSVAGPNFRFNFFCFNLEISISIST